MKNILIIQTAFIGDVILTLPLVEAIKEEFPWARIACVVTPQSAGLLEKDPRCDEVIVYDKKKDDAGIGSFCKLSRYIKSMNFDTAFLPHLSLRTTLLAYTARIEERIGFDSATGSCLLTTKVSYNKNIHLVERILHLLSPLGIKKKKIPPRIFIPEEDKEVIKRFLISEGAIRENELLIGINPSSFWPTKRWLKERYAQLADALAREYQAKIVIFGGKEDKELACQIAGMMRHKPIIAAGVTTLVQSAALLKECCLLVTNDTGPMHLAMAVNTPCVIIYGPTSPQGGVKGPYGNNFITIQKEGLYCRPCGTHGGKRCKEGTLACMEGISVEEVLGKIQGSGFVPNLLPQVFCHSDTKLKN